MKWELKLREARDSGIEQGLEQEKEDTIVSSLKEKLPIQVTYTLLTTTTEKVKETAKKYKLEKYKVFLEYYLCYDTDPHDEETINKYNEALDKLESRLIILKLEQA